MNDTPTENNQYVVDDTRDVDNKASSYHLSSITRYTDNKTSSSHSTVVCDQLIDDNSIYNFEGLFVLSQATDNLKKKNLIKIPPLSMNTKEGLVDFCRMIFDMKERAMVANEIARQTKILDDLQTTSGPKECAIVAYKIVHLTRLLDDLIIAANPISPPDYVVNDKQDTDNEACSSTMNKNTQ